MKKILIGLLVVGGLYYAFGHSKKTENATLPSSKNDDFFNIYENQIVVDSEGKYMLVKQGKIYNPTDVNSLIAWQKANPTKPEKVDVNFPAWVEYLANYGGTF